MAQDQGASASADRAATPSEPSPAVSGVAGIPCAFTPGPWDCTGCQFPDDDQGGVYYRIQAEGMDASGPNARLIAAAPDLYEALAELLAYASKVGGGILWHVSDQECAKKARAALAKARGQ